MEQNQTNQNPDIIGNRSRLRPGEHSKFTYEIRGTDTDYKDQIQMHSILSMMQEAASVSAADYGWGAEVTDKMGTCWILLRMSVRMKKLPAWLQRITIETWSRGADRLFFLRDFIMYDETGEKIGAGSSTWILANKESHRPVRPSALMDMSDLPLIPSEALTFDPPQILPENSPEWMMTNMMSENSRVKFADFSEIDRNLHVNNTRYAAWCMDAAHSSSLDQPDVLGLDINYNSEIRYGEKVILFFKERNPGELAVDGFIVDQSKIAFSAILYRDELNHQ